MLMSRFQNLNRERHERDNLLDLKQLSKPFWVALVVGSVSLLLFVSYLTILMDRGTLQSSERIFESILNDRMGALERVATEYGYWDEAVEEVVFQKNEAWIIENLIDSMLATHDLSNAHIFDGKGNVALNIVDGKINDTFGHNLYTGDLVALIESARVKKQGSAPKPVSAFVESDSGPYLASAINMTTYTSQADINTDHVLLITRKIDEGYLAAIRKTYNLWDLEYTQVKPSLIEASYSIYDTRGNQIGRFTWHPSLAGKELLPLLIIGVMIVFVAMLTSARTYLRRATILIHELESARLQAELAQNQLHKLASQDALTGLSNRRHLVSAFEKIKNDDRPDRSYSFMSIDLDGFKQINDTLGHDAGDSVLQHFATLFQKTIGENGEVFRLGGDEFCAILHNTDHRKVIRIGKKIIEVLSRKQKVDDLTVRYGASIGVSFSKNVDAWMPEADSALYSAKRNGRSGIEVFENQPMEEQEVA